MRLATTAALAFLAVFALPLSGARAQTVTLTTGSPGPGGTGVSVGSGGAFAVAQTFYAPANSAPGYGLLDFSFWLHGTGTVRGYIARYFQGGLFYPAGTISFNFFEDSTSVQTVDAASGYQKVTAVFDTPIYLSPANIYAAVMFDTGTNDSMFASATDGTVPYLGGQSWQGIYGSSSSSPIYLYYDPVANSASMGASADLAFSADFITVSPEPGTLVLVATGLIGLVGVVRRRRLTLTS